VTAKSDYDALRQHLFHDVSKEQVAFLLSGVSETAHALRLLVREVIPVPQKSFQSKTYGGFRIDPDFIMRILKRAKLQNLCILLVHSHPFSDEEVAFSGVDDYGESLLMPKALERIPNRPHGAMVFGLSSIDARVWLRDSDHSEPVDLVRIVGNTIEEIYPTGAHARVATELKQIHDRQILALGNAGQRLIQRTRIGIVGLGGTGSQVFQYLAHLGASDFILVDHDTIEESNLSRVVGSTPEDAQKKRPKLGVMERLGKSINSNIEIAPVIDSVCNASAALKLRDVDVIFCCTDNLTSRMVLNRIAFQYLIPVIDMGIDIQCDPQEGIQNIGGRVMTLLPDGPCLECMGILDPGVLTEEAVQRDSEYRYITGTRIRNPSVISLNGVVASLATTEFIRLVTGFATEESASYQLYLPLKGIVRKEKMSPVKKCTLCKEVKALGDGVNLPCNLNR